ncbi:MAG: hypothetical protein KAR38_11545, partial [Calditrichia bacterium]|nr:hypothetical protein [Calditrichia bacterium]
MITYKKIPFPEFSKKTLNILQLVPPDTSDSLQKIQKLSVVQKFEKAFSEDVSDLKKSGSFVRGFQVGSNQNLTLNSSLNLFIKGNITENTSITAALTDENTPIQPEGNTQRLNEVDKVYIKVKSPYVQGTMGDFDFYLKESSLDRLQRKLQGVYLQSNNAAGKMSAIYASKRGNFHHNSFLGQEGNQGPYLLTGKNGERNIIILAGSERVYINGLLKKRSENLDYVIDYSAGEITFTSRLLISSESRIEVDFEYLDSRQRFGKNLYMGRYKKKLFSGFSIKGSFYEETDDINNYLADSEPLSAEEKSILKNAGNNPDSAFISGVDS